MPEPTDQAAAQPTEAIVTDRGTDTPAVIKTHSLTWWQIIGIRAVRAALVSFMGYGTISAIGHGTLPTEAMLTGALRVAGGAFLWAVILNGYELMQKLDQTHPELRA